jgi:hypothetical protein
MGSRNRSANICAAVTVKLTRSVRVQVYVAAVRPTRSRPNPCPQDQSGLPGHAAAGTGGRCATPRSRATHSTPPALATSPTGDGARSSSTPTDRCPSLRPACRPTGRLPSGYPPTASQSSRTHPCSGSWTTARMSHTPEQVRGTGATPAPLTCGNVLTCPHAPTLCRQMGVRLGWKSGALEHERTVRSGSRVPTCG